MSETTEFIKGTTGDTIEVAGVITQSRVNPGSKSDHVGPILISDGGEQFRLYLIGDNPFENKGMSEYLGVRVAISGVWRGGVIRVQKQDLVKLDMDDEAPTDGVEDIGTDHPASDSAVESGQNSEPESNDA